MAEARFGIHGLENDLARQRERMAERSPPYARALELLPDVLVGPPGRFVAAAWEHRQFFAWYDRPLLLLAALRHDALAEGPSHPLWAGFGAADPSADEVTAERLAEVLDGSRERVFDSLAHRGVQTNETSRAVAWLWPAALAGASRSRRPIALADVGASAGLNLVADDLPGVWTDEGGAPLQVATRVRAVTRVGLDPAPLDALAEEDALWLRACVWPGERDREERLLAAIDAFRAARIRPDAPILLPISATNVPGRLDLLSAAEPGKLVIAYQTIVRDYLDPADRDDYQDGMRAWLATHPPGEALWVELETLPEGSDPPASIVAHVRASGGELRSIELGRCGYHPRRIHRTPGGEAELRALLAHEARAQARV
jgi:hypothetical protein